MYMSYVLDYLMLQEENGMSYKLYHFNKFLHFLCLSTCISSARAEVCFLFLKHIFLEYTLLNFYTFYFYPRVSVQHVKRYVLVFETHLQRRHPV